MIVRVGAGKRASVTARLYLFHVRLAEIDPPIWRRIAAPWTRTLHDLHGILQAAMGWQDYHLYQFEIGETPYKDPDPEDRDPVGPDPRVFTIDDLALEHGAKFQYTYDFGDDWQRMRCRLPGSPPRSGPRLRSDPCPLIRR